MKTLYKNSSRIAAAIVGSMVFCSGVALALTTEFHEAPGTEIHTVGRITVTPDGAEFSPTATLGRFEITPTSGRYVPESSTN